MSTLIDNWRDFARLTVTTGDLDPMYDLMSKMQMGYRERYALHFFMFYDAGEAAKCADLTDQKDFWFYVIDHYSTFKRGTERRHFRGNKGLDAVLTLRDIGTPSDVWYKMHAPTYSLLTANAEKNFKGCQIGPYFIWKAMDLLDRCMRRPVTLSMAEAVKGMPDEPRKCAKTVWPHLTLDQVLEMVVDEIKDLPAPGSPDRMCGYSEAETILCMIKGYFLTKTHTIGDDVNEKHNQLKDFPELCKLLPPKQDWKRYERSILDPQKLSA